jgi:hypothetical protein
MFIPGTVTLTVSTNVTWMHAQAQQLALTTPPGAGAYVTSIAFLSFCGCEGYSYSQIPY